MEKRKKIGTISSEFQLPEPIIQHIQSFLNGKQAAQTSVLSKLWYSAFSTRPNLDFDERNFQNRGNVNSKSESESESESESDGDGVSKSEPKSDGNEDSESDSTTDSKSEPESDSSADSESDEDGDSGSDEESQVSGEFVNFVKKTWQRYAESNLKIESFRLWMKSTDSYSIALADESIVNALKMGANDLNLELYIPPSPSYRYYKLRYVVPCEVLENEALVKLSANRCKIDRLGDRKVCWSRLKSLSLCQVHMVDDDDILWDIISGCPLIENLSLSDCRCLIEVHRYAGPGRTLAFRSRPLNEFEKGNVGSFQKLKFLLLERVKLNSLFFDDFSLKFPCLEGLTLNSCEGYEGIQISSHALKFLSLAEKRESKRLRAEFNLPSIHKFTYSGSSFPMLSFKPASREWESDISISCWRQCFGVSFYRELKTFLRKLKSSKISLSLELHLAKDVRKVEDVKCLPKPVVENLNLSIASSYISLAKLSTLMDGLFWSCRPKFITPIWHCGLNKKLLELLYQTLLIQQENQDCCVPNKSMIGLRDLEEVNVEFFEEALSEWRPFLAWKTLLNAPTSSECRSQIRFRLRWGTT